MINCWRRAAPMRGWSGTSLGWLPRSAEGSASHVPHWNKLACAIVNLIRQSRRVATRLSGVTLGNYTDALCDAGDAASKTVGDSCSHTTSWTTCFVPGQGFCVPALLLPRLR
jgi:hypothetical protein